MRSKPARIAVIVAAAAVAATAVVVGALRLADTTGPGAQAFDAVPLLDARTPAPKEPAPPGTVAVDSTTPAGAAGGFLAAEAARDDATSFSLLDARGRQTHGTVAGWTAAHGGLLPIAGASLQSVEEDGDKATVVVDVALHARLDPVAGLVPPGGTLRLSLVREEGRWRVALDEGSFTPRWPSDGGAPTAAANWARMRQACTETGDREYAGGLLGPADVAANLCGSHGDLTAGKAQPLAEGPDAAALAAAFGPSVFEWGRVVRISGAASLQAVLAPVGSDWQVVGAFPASSSMTIGA